MAGKYVGFDKLKGELAKRPGVKNAAGLAAAIGRKKYGAKRMANAARAGRNLSSTPDQQDRMRGREEGALDLSPTSPEGYEVQRRRQRNEEQRRQKRTRVRPIPNDRGGLGNAFSDDSSYNA